MTALRQIVLICLATSSIAAQTLDVPPRAIHAVRGSEFIQKIQALDWPQRDQLVLEEVLAGNIPDFQRKLCPVTVTNVAQGQTNRATFFAMPDYVAIGSEADYFLAPVSPATAQRIADRLNCLLPTRRMVDAIYASAEVKLVPAPIPPSKAMTTVPVFAQHNATVCAQRQALAQVHPPGALTAGHKKDVVISPRLASVTRKVAIYGWHQTNGMAIQPLYLGHMDTWVDYSQCVRLISQIMLVNGGEKKVAEVLADPKLCGLISDEGIIADPRYATNAATPRSSVNKIAAPTNAPVFFRSSHFNEMIGVIQGSEDVRILINQPESRPTNQPVLLIYYALPNGNTIEQTMGRSIKPGEDWHFDIQHIGAQTRWLRQVITNRTLVVAYLEAGQKSWPAWRKAHGDHAIVDVMNSVRRLCSASQTEVVLASHSGGGSLIFGYLNAVAAIPNEVKRIAFLDSNYGYDAKLHANKLKDWLGASSEHGLCVLAYQDYVALLNGKTFVSEAGGTWGRSRAMLSDLGAAFPFAGQTNGELEGFSALNGRIQFLLKENPTRKIFHTVQVERNGFIHALLAGSLMESRGYEYLGERVYSQWIQENQ